MILILGLNPSLSMMILLTLNFVAGVPTTIDYHKLILDIEVGVSFMYFFGDLYPLIVFYVNQNSEVN
jgi:hypothetical protein